MPSIMITGPGKIPSARQRIANTITTPRILHGTSLFAEPSTTVSSRGLPKITSPAIFTKANAVSAKALASNIKLRTMPPSNHTFCDSRFMLAINVCNVSHSLMKPLNGGKPAMATLPTRKHADVQRKR